MSDALVILFEDNHCLAVCKPAPLLTQGVPPGIPTLESMVKAYLKERYHKPGNVYLGIPHRLDRPVSGGVVSAPDISPPPPPPPSCRGNVSSPGTPASSPSSFPSASSRSPRSRRCLHPGEPPDSTRKRLPRTPPRPELQPAAQRIYPSWS